MVTGNNSLRRIKDGKWIYDHKRDTEKLQELVKKDIGRNRL